MGKKHDDSASAVTRGSWYSGSEVPSSMGDSLLGERDFCEGCSEECGPDAPCRYIGDTAAIEADLDRVLGKP